MEKPKVNTVKDVIEQLKELPQDMEVWVTWDESGEYWPTTDPIGRIDQIVQIPHRRHPEKLIWERDWKDEENKDKDKKSVCVMEIRL